VKFHCEISWNPTFFCIFLSKQVIFNKKFLDLYRRTMTEKTWSWSTPMDMESVLWTLLALYVFISEPTWFSWSVVCGSFFTFLKPPLHYNSSTWRGYGCGMSAVLVPILLKTMAISNQNLYLYYKVSSLLWTLEIRGLSAAIALALTVLVARMDADFQDTRTMLVLVLYLIVFHSILLYPSLYKVFTKGEWTLLTSLASIATCEWNTQMSFHGYVALTGVIGCIVACAISPQISNPYIRGGLLVSIPFLIVDGACWYRDQVHAATWLALFLWECEGESSLQYPRAVWLMYWLVVVVVAIVQAPQQQQQCSVVSSRKWFHLVAIILFLPVTLEAPQLMSLSYAIALCVLMVMESMKCYLPTSMQQYYQRFLDTQKEQDEQVVISHIFLLLGCAMPLWITECTTTTSQSSQSQTILPVFGILVLGVGDSLAAVVGSSQWGRQPWWFSRKTIEGSTAMWMGMAICCCLFQRQQHWIAAVTFTTLLEAFTTQIDNLILPLAGATVILLQHQLD
jgi:dolichol kinase